MDSFEKAMSGKEHFHGTERGMVRTLLWAAVGKALVLSIFTSLLATALIQGVFGLKISSIEIAITVTGWSVLLAVIVQCILLMRQ